MTSPTILVGTTKGAFLLTRHEDGWQVEGPHCDGWPINHMAADPETGALWAGGGSDWHGAGVWRSTDRGGTWTLAKLSGGQMDAWAANDPDFAALIGYDPGNPPPFGDEIDAIWSLQNGPASTFVRSSTRIPERGGWVIVVLLLRSVTGGGARA